MTVHSVNPVPDGSVVCHWFGRTEVLSTGYFAADALLVLDAGKPTSESQSSE